MAAASAQRVAAVAKKRLQQERSKLQNINDDDPYYSLHDENKATAAEEGAEDIIGDLGDFGGGGRKKTDQNALVIAKIIKLAFIYNY